MQAAEALSLLQWLGAELQALPQGQRAEALRLPLLLGGKLTSRVAARALRALLLPPQSAAAASPSAPSSISPDEPVAPERSPVSRVQSPRCVIPHNTELCCGSVDDATSHHTRRSPWRTVSAAVKKDPGDAVCSCSPETVAIRQAATTTPAAGSEDMFSAPDLAAPSASISAPPLPSAAQVVRVSGHSATCRLQSYPSFVCPHTIEVGVRDLRLAHTICMGLHMPIAVRSAPVSLTATGASTLCI